MEKKPVYYDGSVSTEQSAKQEDQIQVNVKNEDVKVTEEMRKNISGNPYVFE